jgi:quercetin dioxygenase-like cupin family protein
MPATIQIMRGEAEVTLGDESIQAGEGCIIHMQPSPGAWRCRENAGRDAAHLD